MKLFFAFAAAMALGAAKTLNTESAQSAVTLPPTDWRVTPPPGFKAFGKRQWERAFGLSIKLRETISAGTTVVRWRPGAKWDTTQACFTGGIAGGVIEGNHYGRPTFSYTCADDYATEVYDLVSDVDLSGGNDAVRVIRLIYQGSPGQPANPLFRKPAEKPQKPSLATFRRMQESLAPGKAAVGGGRASYTNR